jgi:hypothetical protein
VLAECVKRASSRPKATLQVFDGLRDAA